MVGEWLARRSFACAPSAGVAFEQKMGRCQTRFVAQSQPQAALRKKPARDHQTWGNLGRVWPGLRQQVANSGDNLPNTGADLGPIRPKFGRTRATLARFLRRLAKSGELCPNVGRIGSTSTPNLVGESDAFGTMSAQIGSRCRSNAVKFRRTWPGFDQVRSTACRIRWTHVAQVDIDRNRANISSEFDRSGGELDPRSSAEKRQTRRGWPELGLPSVQIPPNHSGLRAEVVLQTPRMRWCRRHRCSSESELREADSCRCLGEPADHRPSPTTTQPATALATTASFLAPMPVPCRSPIQVRRRPNHLHQEARHRPSAPAPPTTPSGPTLPNRLSRGHEYRSA